MPPIGPTPQLKAGLFGRRGPGAAPAGKVTPPAPKGPSGVRIEHRVGIQAPPDVIWDILYDVERWPEWNPLYTRAKGQIRIGETLNLTMALPGQPERVIQPTILEWVPREQLHWRLAMMGGLMKSIRYLEIEQLAEASCIVSNGEIFSGLMGPSIAKRMGRSIHRGFTQMSEALKSRAEATWQAQAGAPTSSR